MADRAAVRRCRGGGDDHAGPVVITTAFIGYLVAGPFRPCITAVATFLPCYLLTILPAPYFEVWQKHPALMAFVDGITAAGHRRHCRFRGGAGAARGGRYPDRGAGSGRSIRALALQGGQGLSSS